MKWQSETERREYMRETLRRLDYRRELDAELQHRVGITLKNFLDVPGMETVYEIAVNNHTPVEDVVSGIDFDDSRFDFLF